MANFGSVEIKGYKEIMDMFDPARIKKVVNRSLFRTAKQIRTRCSSKIREGYNIKKKDLDDKINVSRGNMQATIKVSGKSLNAIEYGNVSWSRRAAGATVRIKRGAGKLIPHSFQIAKFGYKVFVPKPGKRSKTAAFSEQYKPVAGPSAKQLMGDRVIQDTMQRTLEERNQVNFDQQLKFATGAEVDLAE
jgi:hypothetical protein